MTTIQIKGLKRLQQKFKNAPEVVTREWDAGMDNIIAEVVPAIQSYTPVDTGKLKASIEGRVEQSGSMTRAVFGAGDTPGVIVASVEGGTRPHWPPWGPGSALEGWAKRKGIPPFLVARAIALHGTIKRFGRPRGGAEMFKKGLEDSRTFILAEHARIKRRIIAGITKS